MSNSSENNFIKTAIIKKLPSGEYAIFSLKGKRLGKYKTRAEAEKRLSQIEFFKHQKKASKEEKDTYSSIMRDLVKNYEDSVVKEFQKSFKEEFDKALLNGEEEPEEFAMSKAISVVAFHEIKRVEKFAAAIEMGSPENAGQYLAELIRFLLRRISPPKRQGSIDNLKKKIFYINEYEIARKKMPASASMGQSIMLLKIILLEHSPSYIRSVLNSIVRNL